MVEREAVVCVDLHCHSAAQRGAARSAEGATAAEAEHKQRARGSSWGDARGGASAGRVLSVGCITDAFAGSWLL